MFKRALLILLLGIATTTECGKNKKKKKNKRHYKQATRLGLRSSRKKARGYRTPLKYERQDELKLKGPSSSILEKYSALE